MIGRVTFPSFHPFGKRLEALRRGDPELRLDIPEIEAFVTNEAIDLAADSTVDGVAISTGKHIADTKLKKSEVEAKESKQGTRTSWYIPHHFLPYHLLLLKTPNGAPEIILVSTALLLLSLKPTDIPGYLSNEAALNEIINNTVTENETPTQRHHKMNTHDDSESGNNTTATTRDQTQHPMLILPSNTSFEWDNNSKLPRAESGKTALTRPTPHLCLTRHSPCSTSATQSASSLSKIEEAFYHASKGWRQDHCAKKGVQFHSSGGNFHPFLFDKNFWERLNKTLTEAAIKKRIVEKNKPHINGNEKNKVKKSAVRPCTKKTKSGGYFPL